MQQQRLIPDVETAQALYRKKADIYKDDVWYMFFVPTSLGWYEGRRYFTRQVAVFKFYVAVIKLSWYKFCCGRRACWQFFYGSPNLLPLATSLEECVKGVILPQPRRTPQHREWKVCVYSRFSVLLKQLSATLSRLRMEYYSHGITSMDAELCLKGEFK